MGLQTVVRSQEGSSASPPKDPKLIPILMEETDSGTVISSHFYSKFNYQLAAHLLGGGGEHLTIQNLSFPTEKIRDLVLY